MSDTGIPDGYAISMVCTGFMVFDGMIIHIATYTLAHNIVYYTCIHTGEPVVSTINIIYSRASLNQEEWNKRVATTFLLPTKMQFTARVLRLPI